MKFTVLTYNIHKGFALGGWRFTLHGLRQALADLKPDVVLLQEVVGRHDRWAESVAGWPPQAQHTFFSDQLGYHSIYGKNADFEHRHHGNAILSLHHIDLVENVNISNNRFERRGLLHAKIRLATEDVHLFNLHLDLTEKGREQQVEKILKRGLEHVPAHSHLIIGGDTNDWRQILSRKLETKLAVREAYRETHGHYAKTFPAFRPTLKLDRLYTRNLKIHSAQVLTREPWRSFSDHLPILFELEFQPKKAEL